MKNYIYVGLLVVILVGIGSFYGGIKYQQRKSPSGNAAFQGMRQFRGAVGGQGQNGRANGGLVNGDVLSKDDKSMTIKLRDGGSKLVFYTTSTQVKKMADGAMSDIDVGTSVMVTGDSNSDGSVTAQQIQLRPNMPVPPAGAPQGQQQGL